MGRFDGARPGGHRNRVTGPPLDAVQDSMRVTGFWVVKHVGASTAERLRYCSS